MYTLQELTPATRFKFLSFLFTIGKGDGVRAADLLLEWSPEQQCTNPDGFRADMRKLFNERCDVNKEDGVDIDNVLKEILRLARRHEVSVDGSLASLIIGVVCITGFASGLDKGFNLINAAIPTFLAYNLTGRIIGRSLH